MSSINYYAKYLKYKKKYLDLVDEINYGGAGAKKVAEAEAAAATGQPLTKKQEQTLMNKKVKTKEVKTGSDCSEIKYMYCPEGQYCNNGHCENQTEDDIKTKTFINDTKRMIKEQNMSAKEKEKEALKAQSKAIKEKEKEDKKSGQKGGEYELDINELLSESSFN